METLDTKTPELNSSGGDTPVADKKDVKQADKPVKKETPQVFGDKEAKRPSLFEDKKQDDKAKNLYDLFEQKADKNPPLEALAQDEKALVVEDQTAANLAAANTELVGTEPQTPQEAAAIAGATFNEAVRERIENGQEPTPDMLDGAMNDTAEILGLDPEDIEDEDPELEDDEESAEEQQRTAQQEERTAKQDKPDQTEPVAAEVPITNDETLPEGTIDTETTQDLDEPEVPETPETVEEPTVEQPQQPPDDVDPPVAAANPVAPGAAIPPLPPLPPGGGGGGGGWGGPGPGPGGGFNFNPGPAMNAAANVAIAAPWLNPNVAAGLAANRVVSSANRRHSHLPYVLVGGVVGYLIGRRRGRIKAEKKLLPVQKKLEQQVGDLQYQVAAREAKIRKLAYEKSLSHPQIFVDLPQRLKELQELQKASLKKEDFAKAASEAAGKKSRRMLGKEAVGVVVSSELLSKITEMTDRSETPRLAEEQPVGQNSLCSEQLKSSKDMTTAELLELAAQIPIEDRSLRRLYESGRISESNLRRVVEAYLRGERYDKILHESLKPGDGIEMLPRTDDTTQSADTSSAGSVPPVSQGVLQDPHFISARHEYYQTLSGEEPELDGGNTGRTIVVIVVGVAIAVTLALVFG